MPFIPHTPESLIARSDSKNPAATCKGLTASGRPCRRAVSPDILHRLCWQHVDQAVHAAQPQRPTKIRERSSVDTLVDRLGLLEVQQARRRNSRPVQASKPQPERRAREKHNQQSSFGLLCCSIQTIDEESLPSRVRTDYTRPLNSAPRLPVKPLTSNKPRIPSQVAQTHNRPSLSRDPSSAELLRLIPKSSSPQTVSLLLAELAKPVSTYDEEGFIYMFWLTSDTLPVDPPSQAASSLLEVPARPQAGRRRTSDILQDFSEHSNTSEKKILLKIGRASNVQRRLNEWTRQCGYNLSLIRYYPYHPSLTPPATPQRVPHAHKVERLIHIELAGKRSQGSGKCPACGKEHREWFEAEASRGGVKAVDEVIRRWVDWGMRGTV
jgi:hypothetical protein